MGLNIGQYTLRQQSGRLWRSASRRPRGLLRRQLNVDYVTTSYGIKACTVKSDIPSSIRHLLLFDNYKRSDALLTHITVRPRDRVLDIGAGIGFVGLVATRVCGERNVLSCEANPDLEPIIRKNYHINGWEPNLLMRAVTSDGRDLTFFQQKDDWQVSSAFVRGRYGNKIVVPSVRINDLIGRHDPTVILMDAEGAEAELLPMADLGRVRAVIVDMHAHIVGQELIAQIIARMKERGWRIARKRTNSVVFVRQNCSAGISRSCY